MAPRIFIFSIVLGAENLSYLKSIEPHARAFLTLNILSVATVSYQRNHRLLFFPTKGKAWDILVWQSKLAQFWPDLVEKGLVLVNPKKLEIFWLDFVGKTLVLVNTDASTKSSVMRVGSDTFGDPIFQNGLQN